MKNFIIALKNDTIRHFLTQNACKDEPLWHFFNASLPIQNRIFYERKRMKKLALFLTNVKKSHKGTYGGSILIHNKIVV
jgi:hypothetical protein